MTESTSYDPAFFAKIADGSQVSAREVVPSLLDLLHPRSVVDMGCGTGAWLSVFQEKGITDFLGVDGDYVDRKALLIPLGRFKPADVTQPLALGRRFDLVVSLEVAEHLDKSFAVPFIDNLVSLGDQIVFSAAIPLQGGNHHVNEQWPEYWKALFEARGFTLVDCLRHRFWSNTRVESWYRQNLLLYIQKDRLNALPAIKEELEKSRNTPLSIVHPAVYTAPSVSSLLHMIPRTLLSGIRRRLKKS